MSETLPWHAISINKELCSPVSLANVMMQFSFTIFKINPKAFDTSRECCLLYIVFQYTCRNTDGDFQYMLVPAYSVQCLVG